MKKGIISLLLLGIVAVLLLLGLTVFGPWELPGLGQLSLRQQAQQSQAAGVCPDDGDWGINTGNTFNPSGLVIKTQWIDGALLNNIDFTLASVDTDGSGKDVAGYSIWQMDSSTYNVVQRVQSLSNKTGSVFYCGASLSDTYPGFAVFGFGSTRSNGNRWVLVDQEVINPSGTLYPDPEEFRISNLSPPAGESGYWTADLAGWDTGFRVTAGRTTRITLTFIPLPTPTSSPTPGDTDHDGFTDAVEKWIKTDPADNCADNLTDAAWPPDINNDKKVDQADADAFKPYMLSSYGQTKFNHRFDLNADKKINVGDVLQLRPYMGTSCLSIP